MVHNSQPKTPAGYATTKKRPKTIAELDTPEDLIEKELKWESDIVRRKVAKATNYETLLCPIGSFLTDYGPVQVTEDEVQSCKQALVKTKVLKKYTKTKYRWATFKSNPSGYEGGEPAIFKPLVDIVAEIFNFAGNTSRGRGNDYTYVTMPYKYLPGDLEGTNHKMDACIVDQGQSGKLKLCDGLIPHEFKANRDLTNQITVREHVVGDCRYIMCEDPRRMFIYGITIEDTRMSVWYFSRSHSIKALAFDWTEADIDVFIQLYLSFAFAKPEELGIDPTVHKAPCGKAEPQQYIYECPNSENLDVTPGRKSSERQGANSQANYSASKVRYFMTLQAISSVRPHCISDRITRIWKVIEVDSIENAVPIANKVPVILKDVWLDTTRPTEAENMDNIFQDVETQLNTARAKYEGDDWLTEFIADDDRFSSFDRQTTKRLHYYLSDENYKKLFLTRLHAWSGQSSKAVSKDAVFTPMGLDIFQAQDTDGDISIATHTVVQGYSRARDAEQVKATEERGETQRNRHYLPKTQLRFVYKEVCTKLQHVKTIGNLVGVLDQSLDALRVLFCAGWVHRDISSGNILAFKDNEAWKVKLSDLEFAVKFDHNDHRADPRTGTPYFMPYEVMKQRYLIHNIRSCRNPKTSLANQLQLPSGTPIHDRFKVFYPIGHATIPRTLPDGLTDDVPTTASPVRYNFQHDLESVWWILLYLITACVDHKNSQHFALSIFSQSFVPSSDRTDCFMLDFYAQVGDHLHDNFAELFTPFMEDLRAHMKEQYLSREVFGQLDLHPVYSNIHGLFATKFRELLEDKADTWKSLALVPSAPLKNVKIVTANLAGTKRGRDEENKMEDTLTVNIKRLKLVK